MAPVFKYVLVEANDDRGIDSLAREIVGAIPGVRSAIPVCVDGFSHIASDVRRHPMIVWDE